MGSITETATAFPGQNSIRPQTITLMAEVLRQNGFNTSFFGKCHEVPPWEISPVGPQDRWPTRSGFETFYGFLGGETNQWAPTPYDGVALTEPPERPARRTAGRWSSARILMPDRPAGGSRKPSMAARLPNLPGPRVPEIRPPAGSLRPAGPSPTAPTATVHARPTSSRAAAISSPSSR